MLLKQLSHEDQRLFLCLAELLSLSDKPMLWDGKRRAELTSAHITQVSIDRSAQDRAAMAAIVEAIPDGDRPLSWLRLHDFGRRDVETDLLDRLQKLPLDAVDNPAQRATVVLDMLRGLLDGKKAAMPSVPKLMLYELMMLALVDCSISSVEWQVLSEIRHHFGIEDFIFDDLLERAETTFREAQKTIAIILE